MLPSHRRTRRGLTLTEVLIAVAIAAIIFALAVPKIASARDGASKRAARQELSAAFASARAAALQKGRLSTLTLTSTTAKVQVQSGLAGNTITVWGPVAFNKTLGASIQALSSAPTTINYNARGLLTPTPAGTLKYAITVGSVKDTVCISPAGIILPKGCSL